jgi:hypothetical protein
MSVQASSSRSATKSIGAAFVDLLITLLVFIVMLLTFLIAPLVALALGYLAFVVWKPRAKGASRAAAGPGDRHRPGAAHGFGAGTS